MKIKRIVIILFQAAAAGIIGYAIGAGTCYVWWWYSASAHQIEIRISVTSTTVTKDDLVKVNGELINRTNREYSAPWGKCGSKFRAYMDGKIFETRQIIDNADKKCSFGTYGVIKPGEKIKNQFYINPGLFTNGRHEFYLKHQDGTSNTLILSITGPKHFSSCYGFTEFASAGCSQLSFHPYISGDPRTGVPFENTKSYILNETPIRPIPWLSSDGVGMSTEQYFTANIPKGDPDRWATRLTDRLGGYTQVQDFPQPLEDKKLSE